MVCYNAFNTTKTFLHILLEYAITWTLPVITTCNTFLCNKMIDPTKTMRKKYFLVKVSEKVVGCFVINHGVLL